MFFAEEMQLEVFERELRVVFEGRADLTRLEAGHAFLASQFDVTGETLTAAEANLTNSELALGTVTQRVSATQTAGTDTSCLLQDVEGQFLSQSQAYCGSWTGTGGSGATDSWLVLWFTEVSAAPLAPTNLSPAAGTYLDATGTIPFSGTYNPTNGQPMNALCLSYQQTGGTKYYWTGSAWSTTQTWVAASAAAIMT